MNIDLSMIIFMALCIFQAVSKELRSFRYDYHSEFLLLTSKASSESLFIIC